MTTSSLQGPVSMVEGMSKKVETSLSDDGHAAVVVGAAVDDVAAAVVGDANKGIVGCGLLGSAAIGCGAVVARTVDLLNFRSPVASGTRGGLVLVQRACPTLAIQS